MSNSPFSPKPRKKVLLSKDFSDILVSQETSIIEQRIITILLSSIKDEQDLFISRKQALGALNEKQLSFDDYFQGWANQGLVEFIIPFAELHELKKMKNSVIQNALINMANINWLRLRDESINGFKAVPFIIDPSWNKKSIFFKMDKAVLQHLHQMKRYFSLKKELPFEISSSNTIRFLLWLMRYKKQGYVIKSYTKLLQELSIPIKKYEGHYRFERDFVRPIKADLDQFNDISFTYSFKDSLFSFRIEQAKYVVDTENCSKSIEEIRIDRSLKYLQSKRLLNEQNVNTLRRLYQVKGYNELARNIKKRIDPDIKGDQYVKAIFKLLEKN